MARLEGGCLCGAVRFVAAEAETHAHACHCRMCRRWGGGPALGVDAGADIAWTGFENVATYRSSDWAERGFCRVCGTHLFYRLVDTGWTNLNAGVCDDDSGFALTSEIFVDEQPGWYAFANRTERKTGAEVIAAAQAAGGDP
jgi:hypothetical protein